MRGRGTRREDEGRGQGSGVAPGVPSVGEEKLEVVQGQCRSRAGPMTCPLAVVLVRRPTRIVFGIGMRGRGTSKERASRRAFRQSAKGNLRSSRVNAEANRSPPKTSSERKSDRFNWASGHIEPVTCCHFFEAAVEHRDLAAIQALYQTNGVAAQELKL